MPPVRRTVIPLLLCGLVFTGCRSARKRNPEIESLISTISYDTSVPPAVQPQTTFIAAQTPIVPTMEEPKSRRTIQQVAGDGIKATGAMLLHGAYRAASATFGLDDHDGDGEIVRTARSRADRNLDLWLDERDRWRDDD